MQALAFEYITLCLEVLAPQMCTYYINVNINYCTEIYIIYHKVNASLLLKDPCSE